MIAYAKGARTYERHIDIEEEGYKISPYCSQPHQIDTWIKAFKKAKEMSGSPGSDFRPQSKAEIEYLDGLVRGVYAKRDLPAGYTLKHALINDDIYMAVPLLKGQISCRELMSGEVLLKAINRDEPIKIEDIDSPYAYNEELKDLIYKRGL